VILGSVETPFTHGKQIPSLQTRLMNLSHYHNPIILRSDTIGDVVSMAAMLFLPYRTVLGWRRYSINGFRKAAALLRVRGDCCLRTQSRRKAKSSQNHQVGGL
jgi:hypothetical protein